MRTGSKRSVNPSPIRGAKLREPETIEIMIASPSARAVARTAAATIVNYSEGISAPALGSSLYAFALLLLFSAFVLSIAGYLIKLPLRKYQVRA